MGFTTQEGPESLITPSVGEFISSTANIGAKKSKSNPHQILYKKSNQNQIERKTHNHHITS